MTTKEWILTDLRAKAPKSIRHTEPLIEARVVIDSKAFIAFGNTPAQCFKSLAKRLTKDCLIATCFYMKGESKKPWLAYLWKDGNLSSQLIIEQLDHMVEEDYLANVIRQQQIA